MLKTVVDNQEILSHILLFYYEKYMNGSNEFQQIYEVCKNDAVI